ncbi:MAG: hypothetical protein HKL95_05760 [Phycisphaerae bacterium]|nr:hypothetical protein [Phycisphaerae bacterium]
MRALNRLIDAVLDRLNLVHGALPTPAAKANVLAQGNWLGAWYAKIIAQSGRLNKRSKAGGGSGWWRTGRV